MPTVNEEGAVPLLTIGYGARTLDAFLAVLTEHGVAYLIDVRSAPYSKFKPEFSKNALEDAVKAAGIHYVYMGDTLGGQPKDQSCYEDGKVLYDRVKEREFFREGIRRLTRAVDQKLRVAIMCSEGKPEQCHRTVLIGQMLTDLGISVAHIDENDVVIGQEEALGRRTGGQLSLLDDPEFKSRKRYRKKARDQNEVKGEEPEEDD
jgi:uncharacterized protein (DUF488 family)